MTGSNRRDRPIERALHGLPEPLNDPSCRTHLYILREADKYPLKTSIKYTGTRSSEGLVESLKRVFYRVVFLK